MNDQATELRKLVLRAMRDAQPAAGPAPRLLLLTSGQPNVGVTTLSVNLAVALAEQGQRIVLVDADAHGGTGVAELCGLDVQHTVADVLIARRDIHEAMHRGPAGIQVIPGLWRPGHEPEVSSRALERLVRQFTKLGRHADAILIDVGNATNELVRRLAAAAEDVIVVTTPVVESVMDAYARIKVTLSGNRPTTIWLAVNRCDDLRQAADVFQRVDQSCQRFLGHSVEMLGQVPSDESVATAAQRRSPLVTARPDAAATRAIQSLATELVKHGRVAERRAA